jgi:hypothetical protein
LSVAKKTTDGGKPSKKVAVSKSAKKPDTVYQLKVTLLDTQPPSWRRIQVQDCTLDKLHEHIQTAMGWTNSHLHHFRIGEQLYGDPLLMAENFEDMGYGDSTTTKLSNILYGDPLLMAENFEDMGYGDSTTTKLSDILPEGRRRFRLLYEYDFGDSWQHEVLFEKRVEAEAGQKYPLCLEGARACPPEDVGGPWGYAGFVEAIQDEGHERHEELLEWVGGSFDPEAFDPAAATRMKKGLPDWRRMI